MVKKLLLYLFFLSFSISTFSQVEETTYENKFAIGVNGSTLGGGIEIARNISPHFNIRLRGNTFNISDFVQEIEVDDANLNVTANSRFLEFDISLEYLPFRNSSFKIVGGASYFSDGETTAYATYDGSFEYGEITIGPDEIGDLELTLDYNGFAPYIGLGFGRAVPKKKFGVAFEAGSFYLPEPQVGIVANGMLAPTADQAKTLQQDIEDYRWYPFLNLRLSVRI
ncbi:hypothetical protein SAMN04487907_10952 [Zunongwangia mangrovi]|uniref:Outer membrane protein beta-barrel domain-containing protein n=1 Tax=Zunongwangia mangrovi TaxID=1334022 RepID=A0A1I1M674_9FLAO|nr:hypothetical protein [Zunongwangia mangrovi]SFC80546.1 hypothetical protein SAMN04487907_10952 [Zunongwangia mangrovi]